MPTRSQFDALVMNAYQHLYDFVRLRSDPLADLLLPDPSLTPKEKGLRLHRILLDAIDELKPGTDVAPYSKPWRRHRLMMLRYYDALAPQAVANELSISLRQFYREHTEAVTAVTDTLWNLYESQRSMYTSVGDQTAESLLEREAMRATHAGGFSDLGDVLRDAFSLLQELVNRRDVTLVAPPLNDLPTVAVERGLLRQLVLSAFGLIIDAAPSSTLEIRLLSESERIQINAQAITEKPVHATFEEQRPDVQTLAALCRAEIERIERPDGIGLLLRLPIFTPYTVLIVDDNEDALALYERYLTANAYRAFSLSDPHEVIRLARELQPYAVLLDLMMPDQDGWDVLQLLSTQADTCHIPVVVCSVLKQEALAL